ncbi:MAG: plasmid stabilization protein [Alphaproteobacteria bacterium]|nr:plasmid stabilization protein [Alphaproteobacteria bacterium]
MANMLIRNLDDQVKKRLRLRAAEHGRSMEEEVREILSRETKAAGQPAGLGDSIRKRFAPLGGMDLKIPSRRAIRKPPELK